MSLKETTIPELIHRRRRTMLCGRENGAPKSGKKRRERRHDPRDYWQRNLLENNLCVKLNKSYMQEITNISDDKDKERREIFHLTNSGEDSESKQYQQSRRQTAADLDLATNARERLISWAADADSYLPEIQTSEGQSETQDSNVVMVEKITKRKEEESFPKLDTQGYKWIATSSVKMMKLKGIFQPVNKYEKPRKNHCSNEMPLTKSIHEYQTIMLPDGEKPIKKPNNWCNEANSKQRRGMRVSWSSKVHQKKTDASEKTEHIGSSSDEKKKEESVNNQNQKKSETPETANSKRTTASASSFKNKADSLCMPFKKPTYHTGKTKVNGIGLKWVIPQGDIHRHTTSHSAPLSRTPMKDLHPVTTAMDREGTSLEKIRGKVVTSSCSYDTNTCWMETLKSLKSPSFGLESNFRGLLIETTRDLTVPKFDSMYVTIGDTCPSLKSAC